MAALAQLMAGGADLDSARAVMAMRAGILLRLHVVAASDLPEDQRIKLCVRDAVQAAYAEHAKESASMLENTRTMLPALQAAAEQAARAEGYHGPVTVSLEQVAFDERKLDGLTFPAGIYPALMVRLGPAQGHNCWGLVDRELALASAQVPDDAGTTLREQGEIRWTLHLPHLISRWIGVVVLSLLLVSLLALSASASVVAWGSRGSQVSLVQQKLKQYGYYDGAVDGVFGKETYNAVVWFQEKNGLKADGAVGPSTAAALGITLTGTVSASTYQESEVRILARLVSGEARGEPYVGQVAVAAVVLNRVKSPAFPNTISGVIFQTGAFDAVWDGQFDMEPTENSVRAARDALNGWDPTGGCLYYYNPSTATNSWIWTRQVQLTIGKHAFAI